MADKKKASKKDKEKKGDAKSKKKGGAFTVAGHPRAAAAVRRSKGFGGLAGFILAAFLAHQAGLSISRTLERALIAGIAGYLIAWACAVTVWRQIISAQLRTLAAHQASAAPSRRTIPLGAAGAKPEPAPETTTPAPPAA